MHQAYGFTIFITSPLGEKLQFESRVGNNLFVKIR